MAEIPGLKLSNRKKFLRGKQHLSFLIIFFILSTQHVNGKGYLLFDLRKEKESYQSVKKRKIFFSFFTFLKKETIQEPNIFFTLIRKVQT